MHGVTKALASVNRLFVGTTFVDSRMLTCSLNGVICCALKFYCVLCNGGEMFDQVVNVVKSQALAEAFSREVYKLTTSGRSSVHWSDRRDESRGS